MRADCSCDAFNENMESIHGCRLRAHALNSVPRWNIDGFLCQNEGVTGSVITMTNELTLYVSMKYADLPSFSTLPPITLVDLAQLQSPWRIVRELAFCRSLNIREV